MRRKHLVLFAETIKTKFQLDRPWAQVPLEVQCSALDAVAVVEQVAMESNPRFDRHRFRVACGVWTN